MKKDESNNNSRGEAFNEMLRRAMKGSGQEFAESSPANEQTDDKPAFAEPIYRADETDEADEPLPPKGKKAKHDKEDEARDEAAERKEEKKRKKENKKERARRAFRHFADEDEDFDISLRSLLGGDIFGSKRFRRQIGYFILLCALAIIYISNRYAYQREEIRREDLSKQLNDRKFKALTISSELTEYSMRSSVEENLSDTTLRTSTKSSYYLPVDSVEEN